MWNELAWNLESTKYGSTRTIRKHPKSTDKKKQRDAEKLAQQQVLALKNDPEVEGITMSQINQILDSEEKVGALSEDALGGFTKYFEDDSEDESEDESELEKLNLADFEDLNLDLRKFINASSGSGQDSAMAEPWEMD